ncbi:radical SAM protein [Candidatus Dependentiae bacterium]|nr:radical SAM protein [Candidatus Dependentiae bacterium]
MKFNEICAEKILSRTQISLADYVINHYVGCQYSCLYCYARYSKRNLKSKRDWGSFVDIKINAPFLLEQELEKVKPEKVLLGSITEVYQPVEKKYELTRKILEILAEHKIKTVILTRSDLILRDIDILKKLPKVSVFFTLSDKNEKISELFENGSPSYKKRLSSIENLINEKINVWVHVGPIIPYFTDIDSIVSDILKFKVKKIEFENLNKNSAPVDKMIELLSKLNPELGEKLKVLYSDFDAHNIYWRNEKLRMSELLEKINIKHHFSFLPLNDYFH